MKLFRKPFFAIFASLLILFVSCEQDEIIESQIENLSGEELFKSIIFADGKITKNLEQLEPVRKQIENFSAEETFIFNNFKKDVIEFIKADEPSFFDKFKSQVTSTNSKDVSQAIVEGSHKLYSYAKLDLKRQGIEIDKYSKFYVNDLDLTTQDISSNGLAIWVVVSIALLIVVVVAGNITEVSNSDPIELEPARIINDKSFSHQNLVVELMQLHK